MSVSMGRRSDNVATMINQVIRGHQISFCDEELPFEGKMHNKDLSVTIACQDKVINFSWSMMDPISIFSQYRLQVSKNLTLGKLQ